jgi:hypothetical protein
MGRRRHEDEIERTSITIPSSVITQVRLLLMDPFTQKMGYGQLSGLTTRLYRRWIEEQKELIRVAKIRDEIKP